jgi:hypothetical protein
MDIDILQNTGLYGDRPLGLILSYCSGDNDIDNYIDNCDDVRLLGLLICDERFKSKLEYLFGRAAERKNLKIIQFFFDKLGTKYFDNYHTSVLNIASRHGNDDIVRYIVGSKRNVKFPEKAFILACTNGHVEIVARLLEKTKLLSSSYLAGIRRAYEYRKFTVVQYLIEDSGRYGCVKNVKEFIEEVGKRGNKRHEEFFRSLTIETYKKEDMIILPAIRYDELENLFTFPKGWK